MTKDRLRSESALERLANLHPKMIDLGLERGLGLLKKLGNPHLNLPPVFHIAGTNGKGSCVAFMRGVFEQAGLKTHCYTSPHLVRFHERIRLGGTLIDDKTLADLLEYVEAVNANAPITFFEMTTCAALLAFHQHPADVVLLETGLGGRGDSTNVIPSPVATIITPIARDHEHFLGDGLGAIAAEKAGIMRSGVPCFSAKQSPEAEDVLMGAAEKLSAPFYYAGRDFDLTPTDDGMEVAINGKKIALDSFGLNGRHQCENAGLITACLMASWPDLTGEAFKKGIASAEWHGRIQHLKNGVLAGQCPPQYSQEVQLWLDGAHNAHGAEALAAALVGISPKPWVLICGALNTRPPEDFLSPLKAIVDDVITITIPDQDASLTARELASVAQGLNMSAVPEDNLQKALAQAITKAQTQGGNIIISGSLYLAGHVLKENQTPPQ